MEKWIDIPCYEGMYQISDKGRIRSFVKRRWDRNVVVRFLNPHKMKSGALQVVLKGNKHFLIHKLMWELFIGPIPEGYCLDHIDRNPSNNCFGNLRLANKMQNGYNREKTKVNTIGYKGVSSSNRDGKPYRAYISYKGTRKTLGYFNTKEEAAKAYDDAALKYHKEFACLNFKEALN